jgi:uncharacterized protein YndB with AHSA1/START domain
MLKTIALVVAALIAALLIYAATKPDTFRIERSATIAAPADKVFPLINDVKAFNTWNPFNRMEPNVDIQYEGPAAGKGAAYTWKGNKTGAGRMEVSDSVPSSKVSMKLDFSKPFEAHNNVDFTLQPDAAGTRVTWAMYGPMPYLNRLMTVFFDMDKTVGKDFEAGLVNLKGAAEKPQ